MTPVTPRASIRTDYRDFIESLFLHEAMSAGLRAVRGGNWTSAASALDCGLDVVGTARYDFNGSDEVLARMGSGLVHVIQRERAVTVRIAAADDDETAEIERMLRELIPPTSLAEDSGAVEARFWWSQPQGSNRQIARTLNAPSWPSIRPNYAGGVRKSLDGLVAQRPPIAGGRLLLFQGAPGTGKTHATLALASAWQSWLDTEIISDPEQLFGSPQYLLDVVTRGREARSKRDRWQLLVVEDAGEFLTPYAKSDNGQALSRLLNLTDGALGQATNTLVLITTNEKLDNVHEAIARPGRCLASVSFASLMRDEIQEWCRLHSVPVPDRTSMTLAELYALTADVPIAPATERRFGFAA
ncbi:MAG TPA: DUF5925 domain-containing protein [Baekduia sp.]|nr:DUF5925 domain-containing protein [Baekduia sp.]